ncbi:hypothetical protein LNP07_06710 [Apilactobacillus sp. M161]|uniref:Uncharacterized protein n=1 Tax=Apilactobacillus xinyiensis TaxID=2841032 RepID=A0ABT0I380_9LACO|nr:hypothetical protein [Apilactobacillus xinyiensis]MCK8625205.1 hypothetical protein [Apilactobacillus xinyiensis]
MDKKVSKKFIGSLLFLVPDLIVILGTYVLLNKGIDSFWSIVISAFLGFLFMFAFRRQIFKKRV